MSERVLGVIRLSGGADGSASPERQRRRIERWAEARGHVVAAWVEDPEETDARSPFEREGLGPWLTDPVRTASYDLLVAYRMDLLSHRLHHTMALLQWTLDHDKDLAVVDEGPSCAVG